MDIYQNLSCLKSRIIFFIFLSLPQHSRTFPRWDSTAFCLTAAQILNSETGQCWVSFVTNPSECLAPTEGSTRPLMDSFLRHKKWIPIPTCAEVQGSCSTPWDQGGWNVSSACPGVASAGRGEESRTRNAPPLIALAWHMFLICWKFKPREDYCVVFCYSCFVNVGFMFEVPCPVPNLLNFGTLLFLDLVPVQSQSSKIPCECGWNPRPGVWM